MTTDTKNDLKRYYSIGEVASMFGISKSIIRFWETEFDFLSPHKNSKGERRFTPKNLEELRLIHTLVKERGFTLAGAKEEIKNIKKRNREKKVIVNRLEEVKSLLRDLSTQL